MLFNDLTQNVSPFWTELNKQIGLPSQIKVDDIGYEVCFFRDAFQPDRKLIMQRQQALEKQTVDLVLWLSNQSMIVVEAKAQQGFHMDQINALCKSRKIILETISDDYPIKEIYLVGDCTKRYRTQWNGTLGSRF